MTFGLSLLLAPRVDLAVGIGIALGIAVHLWRERRIHIATGYDAASGVLTLVPVGVFYFGSANVVDEALLAELVRHPDARRIILDLRRVGRIDYTGAMVLQRIAQSLDALQVIRLRALDVVARKRLHDVRPRVVSPRLEWVLAFQFEEQRDAAKRLRHVLSSHAR